MFVVTLVGQILSVLVESLCGRAQRQKHRFPSLLPPCELSVEHVVNHRFKDKHSCATHKCSFSPTPNYGNSFRFKQIREITWEEIFKRVIFKKSPWENRFVTCWGWSYHPSSCKSENTLRFIVSIKMGLEGGWAPLIINTDLRQSKIFLLFLISPQAIYWWAICNKTVKFNFNYCCKVYSVVFHSFDMDPTIRVTTISAIIGQLFMSLSIFGCQQNFVQRYCSMESQSKVTKWVPIAKDYISKLQLYSLCYYLLMCSLFYTPWMVLIHISSLNIWNKN